MSSFTTHELPKLPLSFISEDDDVVPKNWVLTEAIRSNCDWYEFGEKSNKFFLTLEKRRATQNTVRKVLSNEQEITDLSKINTHIYQFYQQLYMERQNISEDSICNFLNGITIP